MNLPDPLSKSKEEYSETINKISMPSSAVGIDAQYTHAIILEYLKQISARIDRLEQSIQSKK